MTQAKRSTNRIKRDLRKAAKNAATAALDKRNKWERAADNHAAYDHSKLFPMVQGVVAVMDFVKREATADNFCLTKREQRKLAKAIKENGNG